MVLMAPEPWLKYTSCTAQFQQSTVMICICLSIKTVAYQQAHTVIVPTTV